jgi:hypothetical protein
MFEPLRDALRGFSARLDPDERRTSMHAMRDALVHAKLGLNDLRAALATTAARLATERTELETVRRRQGYAEQANELETVAIAEKFALQHQERVLMLETKQMVQQHELSIAEREYEAMSAELRMIMAGVAPGVAPGVAAHPPGGPDPEPDAPLPDDGPADADPDADPDALRPPARRTRAEREADAEQRLAALKRRMGK